MEVVYTHCCGLDVHKKSITACVIMPEEKETKTFGTMTEDLLNLADWVVNKGCRRSPSMTARWRFFLAHLGGLMAY